MGCGGAKVKEQFCIDEPLNSAIIGTGVYNIDTDFGYIYPTVNKIGEMKKEYCNARMDCFILYGSCCYKQPNLINTCRCFLWKLASKTGV